jgi:hypothetical protein
MARRETFLQHDRGHRSLTRLEDSKHDLETRENSIHQILTKILTKSEQILTDGRVHVSDSSCKSTYNFLHNLHTVQRIKFFFIILQTLITTGNK